MEGHYKVKEFFFKYKKYWICYLICWVIFVLLVCLLLGGHIHFGCEGIDIDHNGNIYIGLTEEIRVFDKNGVLLRTINPKTSKGYVFSVEDDKLLVDAAATSYIMDLNGTVLSQAQYPQLPFTRKTQDTIHINGDDYHISRSSFYYKVVIESNGEKRIAVQTPIIDLLAEIVDVCLIAAFFILLFFMLKSSKSQSGDSSKPLKKSANTVCK